MKCGVMLAAKTTQDGYGMRSTMRVEKCLLMYLVIIKMQCFCS